MPSLRVEKTGQCEQKTENGRGEKGTVKDQEEWTKTPARPSHPGDVSIHLQELVLLRLLLDLLQSSQGCLPGHPLRQKEERSAEWLSCYAEERYGILWDVWEGTSPVARVQPEASLCPQSLRILCVTFWHGKLHPIS